MYVTSKGKIVLDYCHLYCHKLHRTNIHHSALIRLVQLSVMKRCAILILMC